MKKMFNVTISGTAFINIINVPAEDENEAEERVWKLLTEEMNPIEVKRLIDFDYVNALWDVEGGKDECSR